MSGEFQAQPFEHGYTVDDNVLPDWQDPTCKHGKSVGRCYDCTMLLEDTRPDGSTRKADTGAGRATQAEPANNSSPVDTAGRSSFTHRIPFEDVQKMRAAVGRK